MIDIKQCRRQRKNVVEDIAKRECKEETIMSQVQHPHRSGSEKHGGHATHSRKEPSFETSAGQRRRRRLKGHEGIRAGWQTTPIRRHRQVRACPTPDRHRFGFISCICRHKKHQCYKFQQPVSPAPFATGRGAWYVTSHCALHRTDPARRTAAES